MSAHVKLRPQLDKRPRDRPRPFERKRISEALRSQLKLLLAVGLLGLFGGALVARFAVKLDYAARSLVQVLPAMPAVAEGQADGASLTEWMPWAASDRVLTTARTLARASEPVDSLRSRIELTPWGKTRLAITAHAGTSQQATALSDAFSAAFVADFQRRSAQQQDEVAAGLRRELTVAQAERARAEGELSRVLIGEGVTDIDLTLGQARARLTEIEEAIVGARVRASAAQAHGNVLQQASLSPTAPSSGQALVAAQRALSTLLAQHDVDHPQVQALRNRMRRLQSRAVPKGAVAMGSRADARAEHARANQLEREAILQRDLIVRLSAVAQRLAPLLSARDVARARAVSIEQASSAARAHPGSAEVLAHASIVDVSNRAARAVAALFAPLLALLLAMSMIIVHEVRDFRVCATTELAHWLNVPVVGRSQWPGRADKLEALIDELAESALDASGTTLVLPLTELERPLALSIASQLNGRAQRQFRTLTGARVTIAQAWEGEGAGPGVKRAAEVADRVLWVVSADTYTGSEIARRREVIMRQQGVAAVLLDAEAHGVTARIGDQDSFWRSRSDSDEAARSVPPPRVPVH